MFTDKKTHIFIYYIISLLTICFFSCSHAPKINFLRGDLAKVFATAQKTHKKVFILITDSTCGNCISLLENINGQKQTLKILADNYVCYKADIQDLKEHTIAEIVKCPSYPFPYFFNSTGDLLAFGFPHSKEYNITNLDDIKISEERFTELFKLPISSDQYKKLVTMNIKATLLLDTKEHAAFALFKNSLDIAAYPYNLRYINLLARPLEITDKISQALVNSSQNASDQFLYGEIKNYVGIQNITATYSSNLAYNPLDYSLSNGGEQGVIKKGIPHPFTFSIKNLSAKPLIIYQVSHPCSCVKLLWPNTPIKTNETAIIRGTFNPYEVGSFLKEIFVHTNSLKNPMGTYKISGIVYK